MTSSLECVFFSMYWVLTVLPAFYPQFDQFCIFNILSFSFCFCGSSCLSSLHPGRDARVLTILSCCLQSMLVSVLNFLPCFSLISTGIIFIFLLVCYFLIRTCWALPLRKQCNIFEDVDLFFCTLQCLGFHIVVQFVKKNLCLSK